MDDDGSFGGILSELFGDRPDLVPQCPQTTGGSVKNNSNGKGADDRRKCIESSSDEDDGHGSSKRYCPSKAPMRWGPMRPNPREDDPGGQYGERASDDDDPGGQYGERASDDDDDDDPGGQYGERANDDDDDDPRGTSKKRVRERSMKRPEAGMRSTINGSSSSSSNSRPVSNKPPKNRPMPSIRIDDDDDDDEDGDGNRGRERDQGKTLHGPPINRFATLANSYTTAGNIEDYLIDRGLINPGGFVPVDKDDRITVNDASLLIRRQLAQSGHLVKLSAAEACVNGNHCLLKIGPLVGIGCSCCYGMMSPTNQSSSAKSPCRTGHVCMACSIYSVGNKATDRKIKCMQCIFRAKNIPKTDGYYAFLVYGAIMCGLDVEEFMEVIKTSDVLELPFKNAPWNTLANLHATTDTARMAIALLHLVDKGKEAFDERSWGLVSRSNRDLEKAGSNLGSFVERNIRLVCKNPIPDSMWSKWHTLSMRDWDPYIHYAVGKNLKISELKTLAAGMPILYKVIYPDSREVPSFYYPPMKGIPGGENFTDEVLDPKDPERERWAVSNLEDGGLTVLSNPFEFIPPNEYGALAVVWWVLLKKGTMVMPHAQCWEPYLRDYRKASDAFRHAARAPNYNKKVNGAVGSFKNGVKRLQNSGLLDTEDLIPLQDKLERYSRNAQNFGSFYGSLKGAASANFKEARKRSEELRTTEEDVRRETKRCKPRELLAVFENDRVGTDTDDVVERWHALMGGKKKGKS